jgi:prevent-host-death family protein
VSTSTRARLFDEKKVLLPETRLDAENQIGHIGHMRKTSLANAKTHLSKFVDLAEHRGQRILILRHGKPAAVIVPADMATTSAPPLTTSEAKDLLDRLARCAPPSETIEAALGRRRHDPAK